MTKATKIKMKPACGSSSNLLEIDQIYLQSTTYPSGYYFKSTVYDFLKRNPNSIYVNISPYPDLQPVISSNNEKYVKSAPDSTGRDNLLCLPRE